MTTFVGFGFGAIQGGLFARHAVAAFDRVVIAYRRPEVIAALRAAGGYYGLNIAHEDAVISEQVGPVEMFNMYDASERAQLIHAVAEASEVVTALSSVDDYAEGRSSVAIANVIAQGLERRLEHDPQMHEPGIFYAAENHYQAAERLRDALWHALATTVTPEQQQVLTARTAFLNTVIGKMSGTVPVSVPVTASNSLRLDLLPIVPGAERAFLVEAFDTILVSACPFVRRLDRLIEKPDLRPFEDAKLYGHNAIHALAAFVGQALGLEYMQQLRQQEGLLPWLLAAFTEESGAALIRKYAGIDALFTPVGWAEYAEDLLARMTQASLQDSCARVARDPLRKLAWDDRLLGTLRLAYGQGIAAERLAFGVWAALEVAPVTLEQLTSQWQAPAAELGAILQLLGDAQKRYQAWQVMGQPPLQTWWQSTYETA